MSDFAITLDRTMLVRPGVGLDRYPEKREVAADPVVDLLRRFRRRARLRRLGFEQFRPIVARIHAEIESFRAHSAGKRKAALPELRRQLRVNGFTEDNVVMALAHCGSFVRDYHGFNLHDEQYFCSWLLLQGALAEMVTGEGKSITAGITAAVAGLAGLPVHVITTNDYLVERDAESQKPIFQYFDLSSAHVTPELEDDDRRAAYRCDICYVSNKQLVFDYLKDRRIFGNKPSALASRIRGLLTKEPEQPFLRGLCFAIVDEADSVLIDDAITPLILSQQQLGEDDVSAALVAISLARRLSQDEDFFVDSTSRTVRISQTGEEKLQDLACSLSAVWRNRRYRHEHVRQALAAMHVFVRDRDYIVRDDQVQLIDHSTGRVMPDRKLQHGLHQMIETKEHCELSGRNETISSISFQRFFTRYYHLCGMSGTISESARELEKVYSLGVRAVPTHQANQRTELPPAIFRTRDEQHQHLLGVIREHFETGRPVLVGTRSVIESERIAALLNDAQLPHHLLNARQDKHEAEVVSHGGQLGAITIATNMAGRGTDIPISDPAKALGGLLVIVAELNDNERIDRQLIGRAARQGDPGSYLYCLSLEDELIQRHMPEWLLVRLRASERLGATRFSRRVLALCKWIQRRNEKAKSRQRREAVAADDRANARLSFAGKKE